MARKDQYRWPWPKVAKAVLARDGYVCQIRGPNCIGIATHADHIVSPRVAPHLAMDPTNLRAACEPCNLGRAASQRSPHPRDPGYPEPSRQW